MTSYSHMGFNIENFKSLQEENRDLHELINKLTARLLLEQQKEQESAQAKETFKSATLGGAIGTTGVKSRGKS